MNDRLVLVGSLIGVATFLIVGGLIFRTMERRLQGKYGLAPLHALSIREIRQMSIIMIDN
jgi:hypothetical protein